jgi:hypothetical protein
MKFGLKLSLCTLSLMLFLFWIGCAPLPPHFIRTMDEPGTWKSIEVRDGMTKDEVWRVIVDALSQKFDLEVLEKDSGYVRTSWKHTYMVRGHISERYRARIIVKMLGSDWKTLQVKCEANWLAKHGWMMGYDSRLLEDVFGDLQGRIGRIRR